MGKGAIVGILLIVVGGVMLVFQKISGLIGDGGEWDAIRMVDLAAPSAFNWIDKMTFLGINNLLDIIVTAPLYILLFCVGVLLLIISGFRKN